MAEWANRQNKKYAQCQLVRSNIAEIEESIKTMISNMQYMRSKISVEYTEAEIADLEAEAERMRKDVTRREMKLDIPIAHIEDRAKELLSDVKGLIASEGFSGRTRALNFAVLFNERPRYNELLDVNEKNLCEVFQYKDP